MCTPLLVQAAPIAEVKLAAPPFREWEPPRVKTSGGEILGLVDASVKQIATGQQIFVTGLAPRDKTVCLNITHVSGRYLASAMVPKPNGASSLSIVLPGNRIARLKAMRGELAILARASETEKCTPRDPILPASWGRDLDSASGYLLVNNGQSLRSRVALAGSVPTSCVSLRDRLDGVKALTTYQMACPVPLGGACGAPTGFTVNLDNGTRTVPLRGQLRNAC